MSQTTNREAIARRAYEIWEREGRPDGRAEEHWRMAEAELAGSRPASGRERKGGKPKEKDASADALNLRDAPAITNLERALPPEERRKAREKRHPNTPEPTPDTPYFVVALDRAHVRIYRASETGGPSRLRLDLAHSMDFPAGRQRYTATEADQAGRFPGISRGTPAEVGAPSGSIDERLPMQEEHERRLVELHAKVIEEFLQNHPFGTWAYVAGPALHHAVFERLSRGVRARVTVTLAKDLVNLPVTQLGAQVVEAQTAARA